ncbi:VanZ family protein [Nocardioides sp. S5]|uniref:VanZ family protein n=1 Tax=Nocardioides sp. S5 TaxID=2017486 RepID=UPI001F5C51EF|nr:VanZ family protein [Nocardioides sp. S5]
MRDHRMLVVASVAYAVGLGVLVAGPWGEDLNDLTVRCYTFFRYDWPIAPGWALPHHYGVLLNMVLFVPVGALLVTLLRWKWWAAVLVAGLCSAAIEVVQAQWLLERIGSVDDVVANTVGAALGAFGALALTLRRRHRSRRAGRPGWPRPR